MPEMHKGINVNVVAIAAAKRMVLTNAVAAENVTASKRFLSLGF
jgi:hypothetical protein